MIYANWIKGKKNYETNSPPMVYTCIYEGAVRFVVGFQREIRARRCDVCDRLVTFLRRQGNYLVGNFGIRDHKL